MIKIVLLVILAEIFAAVGQILFKKSTNELASYSLRDMNTHLRFLTEVLAKPSIWMGFIFLSISLVVWIMALAQGDLSLVFSMGSLQYILILFLAHIFLGEKIDRMKVIGTFLIVFGIVLIVIT